MHLSLFSKGEGNPLWRMKEPGVQDSPVARQRFSSALIKPSRELAIGKPCFRYSSAALVIKRGFKQGVENFLIPRQVPTYCNNMVALSRRERKRKFDAK